MGLQGRAALPDTTGMSHGADQELAVLERKVIRPAVYAEHFHSAAPPLSCSPTHLLSDVPGCPLLRSCGVDSGSAPLLSPLCVLLISTPMGFYLSLHTNTHTHTRPHTHNSAHTRTMKDKNYTIC